MGRVFLGNHGGTDAIYVCKNCQIYLTSYGEMSNPNFTGSTGPAMLFRRVWNIRCTHLKERKMTTGWHIVRDAHCIRCEQRLGWMYEIAQESSQVYKEGQIILENALIVQLHCEEDPLGADSAAESRAEKIPTYERPSNVRSPRNAPRRSRESTSVSSSSSFNSTPGSE